MRIAPKLLSVAAAVAAPLFISSPTVQAQPTDTTAVVLKVVDGDTASVAKYGTDFVVTDGCGAQGKNWDVEQAFAGTMEKVDGLPDGFRFHDLRHYFASVLIAGGCDVKAVQAAMRHGTASMTLDVYAGLWPDADDRARSAASAVLATRPDAAADGLRTTTSQAVR